MESSSDESSLSYSNAISSTERLVQHSGRQSCDCRRASDSAMTSSWCHGRRTTDTTGYHPIPWSQLLDKLGTKFHRLPHVFGDKESNGTIGNTVRRNRKSEIQEGGLQSGNTYISSCRHDSNNILTAIPMFFGSYNPVWLLEILYDLTGS